MSNDKYISHLLRAFTLLCSFFVADCVIAQDIHFTQFNFSPLTQNPANTNLFDGDIRFVGNYKNQWQSVPVAYNTASASADMNFATFGHGSRLGGGLLFYYDRAGDSRFTSMHFAYSMSYIQSLGSTDHHQLSLGYQIGFVNRSFDYTRLTYDNQFNGDIYDPNIAPVESYSRTNFLFLDMSAGIAYRWHQGLRQSVTVGFSIAHPHSPSQTFFNDHAVTLDPRYLAHISAQIKLARRLDIVGEFLYQRQSSKQEFVPGLHFKTYVYDRGSSRVALNTGAYYRVGDAAAVLVGLDYNDLRVNCSYDINHSGFVPASRYNGGFEISVIYILSKVKKITTKGANCPIF